MKTAICKLVSEAPYVQNRQHHTPKKSKEQPDAYEERTWRERIHATEKGEVYITPFTFMATVQRSAQKLSIQIPGKGKQTYTKHFDSGILVPEPVMLGIKKDDVRGQWLDVPSQGIRGGGTRVPKCFPFIDEWKCTVKFIILDDMITEDVFREVLSYAGIGVGFGAFRPDKRGITGRFRVESIKWTEN